MRDCAMAQKRAAPGALYTCAGVFAAAAAAVSASASVASTAAAAHLFASIDGHLVHVLQEDGRGVLGPGTPVLQPHDAVRRRSQQVRAAVSIDAVSSGVRVRKGAVRGIPALLQCQDGYTPGIEAIIAFTAEQLHLLVPPPVTELPSRILEPLAKNASFK